MSEEQIPSPDGQPPANDSEKDGVKPEIEIAKEIGDIVEELPEQQRQKVITLFMRVTKSMSYRGVVPHPDIIKGYNESIPGSGREILDMAQNQSKHRIGMEDKVISAQINQSNQGQIFAFVLALVCLIFAFILALRGETVVASIMGGSTILGLVTVFALGKKTQKEDLKGKS